MRSQELEITDVVSRAANQNAPQMPHRTGGPEKHKGLAEAKPLLDLVGVRGFEPPTPSSRTKCATKLRYTPMSAGREFTESPDLTQAFFAFCRKKSAVRSTIQHSFHPFTGLQPAGDIPVTDCQARRRDAGPSRRRCQSATVPCSSQSAACWRQLGERAGFSSNISRSASLRT